MSRTDGLTWPPIWKMDDAVSVTTSVRMQSIRPFTVGRKNWLFSDTLKGAEASATVYTMVEMAKAHNLNIHAYPEYLLERRPSADMTEEQLEKLAPWNDDVRKACGNNGRKENLEM